MSSKCIYCVPIHFIFGDQPAITCSTLTIETPEQSVKCVQRFKVNNRDTRMTPLASE